jgi:uncharacterized protein YeaO (DUF488 family)
MLRLKRAYEPVEREDGRRVLVERLWPRGLRKELAHFDDWLKEIAPSDSLRKWFHADPGRWPEFEQKYARELDAHAAGSGLDDLVQRAASETVTLIYAAHDEEHNSAVVLKRWLEGRLGRSSQKATRQTAMSRPTPPSERQKAHHTSRKSAHATHGRH